MENLGHTSNIYKFWNILLFLKLLIISPRPSTNLIPPFKKKGTSMHFDVYHISHSLNRYRKNAPAQSADIPVFVRYEIVAKNIGDFQIPGGNFNVYERENSILTYIGVGSSGIVENNDKIKLETGKTHDILCTFIIQGYKINKDRSKAELKAIFENRKDKPISISWTEQFSDGRWDITNSNLKFERLDANRALFTVDVSANSIKEIHFTAQIDKE